MADVAGEKKKLAQMSPREEKPFWLPGCVSDLDHSPTTSYSFLTKSVNVRRDATSANNPHLAKVEKSDLQLWDRLFVNSSDSFSCCAVTSANTKCIALAH